ncbi:MAG: hypothetical protein ACPH89_06450, partial [Candidatus Puniceispirillaceae bacterium]
MALNLQNPVDILRNFGGNLCQRNRQLRQLPEDLLRYLRKNGVSNDELNNSGVMDLINDKKAAGESLTKDEVMEVF